MSFDVMVFVIIIRRRSTEVVLSNLVVVVRNDDVWVCEPIKIINEKSNLRFPATGGAHPPRF